MKVKLSHLPSGFWRTAIFIVPIAVLWSIPIWRALGFYRHANRVYAEEQSLNASNDLSYAAFLLIAYSLLVLLQTTLCFLLARTRVWMLFALMVLPICGLVRIILFRPEEVIVLIPSLDPIRLLAFNATAISGVVWFGLEALVKKSYGISRTNQVAY